MTHIKKLGVTSAIALSSIALMGAGVPKNVPTIQPLQIKESLKPGQTIIVPITIARWANGDKLVIATAGNAVGGSLGYPTSTVNPKTDNTDASQFPLRTFLTVHGKNPQGQETASLTIHAPSNIHNGFYESGVALVLPSTPQKSKNGMTSIVSGRVVAPIFISIGSPQKAQMAPISPQVIPTTKGIGLIPQAQNIGYGISGKVQETLSIYQGSKLLYTDPVAFNQVQPRSEVQQQFVPWPFHPVPGTYTLKATINETTVSAQYTISAKLSNQIHNHKMSPKVVAQPQSPMWPQIPWSQIPIAVGIGALAAVAYILVYYKKIVKK